MQEDTGSVMLNLIQYRYDWTLNTVLLSVTDHFFNRMGINT
ncbi:hypothetical protein HNR62_001146 [Oceanisphaera litoralis]|nr:hypothetical protein [Oceanisphaera litoralis]